jgi:hypothetical protein
MPTGPGEKQILRILAEHGEIERAKAVNLLDGEITLEAFMKRHDAALALWSDKQTIGALAEIPTALIK